MKKEVIFATLLIGSLLLFISSCTSNDASSTSSEISDPLAPSITSDAAGGNTSDDDLVEDLDYLENELEWLGDLDLDGLDF